MGNKTYSTTKGICNKCGYIGECEIEPNGHLTHYRRDGRMCGYSAVSCAQLEKLKTAQDIGAELTTLRQQLAAAAMECEAWRARHNAVKDGTQMNSHHDAYERAMQETDRLIPDLAAVAKGGSNG